MRGADLVDRALQAEQGAHPVQRHVVDANTSAGPLRLLTYYGKRRLFSIRHLYGC